MNTYINATGNLMVNWSNVAVVGFGSNMYYSEAELNYIAYKKKLPEAWLLNVYYVYW